MGAWIVVDRQVKPSLLHISNEQFQFIYDNEAHFFGREKYLDWQLHQSASQRS